MSNPDTPADELAADASAASALTRAEVSSGGSPLGEAPQVRTEDRLLTSDVFETRRRTLPPRNGSGTYQEAAREVPVYHRCARHLDRSDDRLGRPCGHSRLRRGAVRTAAG
jgi:hypothetical protein